MEMEILIKESFTSSCTAEAGDAVRTTDLALEFVVISEFLICSFVSICKRGTNIDTYSAQYHGVRR